MDWRSARAQKSKFADGPRTIAKQGPYTLEVFEWCSTKAPAGSPNVCPSGEFSFVIVNRRGAVKAAGPHATRTGRGRGHTMFTTREAAQKAAERRMTYDPKLKR